MGKSEKRKLLISEHAFQRYIERVDKYITREHFAKQVRELNIPDLLFKPGSDVNVRSNNINYIFRVDLDGKTYILKTIFRKNKNTVGKKFSQNKKQLKKQLKEMIWKNN